jgi:hypothetical protein
MKAAAEILLLPDLCLLKEAELFLQLFNRGCGWIGDIIIDANKNGIG